jgi:hypothetical protein
VPVILIAKTLCFVPLQRLRLSSKLRSGITVSEQPIPKDVQRFIADHIGSVLVLESLLLLYASPGRPWNAFELGAELRVGPEWAQRELEQLTRMGLIRRVEDPPPKGSAPPPPSPPPTPPPTPPDPFYAFQPGGAFDATLAALAQAYQQRRVSVISLIFAKPTEAIQTFADAFNLRKDRHDR